MTSHYLNTLVNWRESMERFRINESLKYLKNRFVFIMGYNWYEYKHPKLRELLGT